MRRCYLNVELDTLDRLNLTCDDLVDEDLDVSFYLALVCWMKI